MSGTSFVRMSHELTWETYCKGSQLSFVNAYISSDATILHIRRAGMIEQQIVFSSPHHNKDMKIIFPEVYPGSLCFVVSGITQPKS